MNQRYYSLDVFRGATVALMILVNNPGSWANIYSPFEHATWHGCTPTDLVFPFFLFAVGNAMAFVMPKFKEKGTSFFLRKVVKRTLLILAIGLFLNWSPFIQWKGNNLTGKSWENIRILGVLQRIALAYFFASLIVYFTKTRTSQIISASILIGYWLLCLCFGDKNDPFSLPGFFGTHLDKKILGINHMYKGEGVAFDPEGLISTIPTVVQVILGFYAGKYIRENSKSFLTSSTSVSLNSNLLYKILTHLFITGSVLIFVGYCWDFIFPINKKIWTSSYVLYTTGLALIVLAILIYLIEYKQVKGRWSRFFDAFGKNPLFIFFLSGFLPRILALVRWIDHYTPEGRPAYISPLPWFYEYICKPISTNLKNGSLLYAFCMIAFYWAIVYFLDKKKIYIKV